VLAGTVLFVLEPTLARRRDGGTHRRRGLALALWPLAVAATLAVALYGGYFGAGIGILMISALSLYDVCWLHRLSYHRNRLVIQCLQVLR
jgi:uncharacterized membrane protein YfcA